MKRIHAGLAAGGLTGLVLITALAVGLMPDTQAVADSAAAPVMTATVQPVEAGSGTPEAAPTSGVQELLEQNRRLAQALEVMQAREAQYQAQIEAANRALLAAQQQSDPQVAEQTGASEYTDDGEDDWDEGQSYEEHEDSDDGDKDDDDDEDHGEHEEHEYEEHDD
jgi:hypothetical protein